MKNEINKEILRVSNVLNLTRQEFNTLERHIYLMTILSLKKHQGLNLELDSDSVIKIEFSATSLKETNRERIKDALDKITSRKIHFDSSNANEEYFGFVVPFSYANYSAKNGHESKITIDINSRTKNLFCELAKGYTVMDLQAILSLKSNYSIRVYELMSQYLNQKKWTVSIEKLRGLLNLEDSQYKNYGMFEKRILTYSQKELWEHCNLHFEWEIAHKKGKKITALTFHIRERNKQERIELNEEIEATKDYLKSLSPADISQKATWVINKYTLNQNQQNHILNNTDVFNEFVKIDLIIEDMVSKGNPPRNKTAYLAKSLGLDKVKFPKSKK